MIWEVVTVDALRHGLRNRCDLRLRVYVHHGGDALGNSLAGDDHHVFLRQALALLGSHDDVAVVGQNKHGLSGDLIDPGQNTLRGGVHGLTAGNHGVAAKIPEHGGKAVARRRWPESPRPFQGRLPCGRFLRFPVLPQWRPDHRCSGRSGPAASASA